jgi:Spy/CpxP family protein refolding chaperone
MMVMLRVQQQAQQAEANQRQDLFHLFSPNATAVEAARSSQPLFLRRGCIAKINKPESQAKVTLEMPTFPALAGYYQPNGEDFMSSFFRHVLLVSVAVLTVLPCAAWAQSQDPGQGQTAPQGQGQGQRGAWMRQRQHMQMLANKLNLTDQQRQQFQQIGQRTRQQAMSIHNDSSLSDEQKKEKLQALHKQSHQEMFGILTPEQKEQLKQLREQMQKDRDKNKAPGDLASAKKKLDDDDPFAGMTSDDDDGPAIVKAP